MKNILIFGATSSIAVATSIQFARENANFFLVARNKDKLSIVIEKLFYAGAGKIEHYIADLSYYEYQMGEYVPPYKSQMEPFLPHILYPHYPCILL